MNRRTPSGRGPRGGPGSLQAELARADALIACGQIAGPPDLDLMARNEEIQSLIAAGRPRR